jgi:hypothetical protein
MGRWEGTDATPDAHNRDPNYLRSAECASSKSLWYKALEQQLRECRVVCNRGARRTELGRKTEGEEEEEKEEEDAVGGTGGGEKTFFSEEKDAMQSEEEGRAGEDGGGEGGWCLHVDVHGCRDPPAYPAHLIVGMGAMRHRYRAEAKRRAEQGGGSSISSSRDDGGGSASSSEGGSGGSQRRERADGGHTDARGEACDNEPLFGHSQHPGDVEAAFACFEQALRRELADALAPVQRHLERLGKDMAEAALVRTDLPVLVGCWPAREQRYTSTQQTLRLGFSHAVQLEFSLALREALFRDSSLCTAVAVALHRACKQAPMAV